MRRIPELTLGEDYDVWPRDWRWRAPMWMTASFDAVGPADMVEADDELLAKARRGLISIEAPWGCSRDGWPDDLSDGLIVRLSRTWSRSRDLVAQPRRTTTYLGEYETPQGIKSLFKSAE